MTLANFDRLRTTIFNSVTKFWSASLVITPSSGGALRARSTNVNSYLCHVLNFGQNSSNVCWSLPFHPINIDRDPLLTCYVTLCWWQFLTKNDYKKRKVFLPTLIITGWCWWQMLRFIGWTWNCFKNIQGGKIKLQHWICSEPNRTGTLELQGNI